MTAETPTPTEAGSGVGPRTDRAEQIAFREAAQIVADCAAQGLGLAAAERALLRRADGLDW